MIRPSVGLLGRIVAILLLTIIIEFGASTLLYERASRYAVQDDEANRLAEHLVISRRLVTERPVAQRPEMAAELSTDRYLVQWRDALPPPHRTAAGGSAARRDRWTEVPRIGSCRTSLLHGDGHRPLPDTITRSVRGTSP